jgi:hypothetical protein
MTKTTTASHPRGRICLYLNPEGRRGKKFGPFARRVEACGGTWNKLLHWAGTRGVELPLPLTGEAENLLLALVEEYGAQTVRTLAGDVYHHFEAVHTAEKILQIAAQGEGLVRGVWQARREAEYDATERARRVNAA